MTTIRRPLSEHILECLVRITKRSHPKEACGFIVNSADPGTDAFILEVPNVAERPEHSFVMDPSHQRLAYSDEDNIVGMWHTHPNGPDGPSTTDLKFVPPGMRCWVATVNGVFEYEADPAR